MQAVLAIACAWGMAASLCAAPIQLWQPPVSANHASHFESIDGRQVWFVDGHPFTALGTETEWKDIVYPHYRQTMHVYDYTFPAARAMHMDMLKVPVKWSQMEPAEGQFDFSYVDHVLRMARHNHLKIAFDWFGHYGSLDGTLYCDHAGWMFAPAWVVSDTKRFPRAVDGNGVIHDNAASYANSKIVPAETRAFTAFLRHIHDADAAHTVIGIQVENEITTFSGLHRNDPKMWRDHSAASNQLYSRGNWSNDLAYSAWEYSTQWLRPMTDAGEKADPLPFFMNFVGGHLQPGITGGVPGEDVATYLDAIPALTFIGLNNYVWNTQISSSTDFHRTLGSYRMGRNLPSITETNSGNTPFTVRSLFLAVGEFGSPLFTPWSLVVSYPENDQPYVLPDGTLANGAAMLAAAYDLLGRAQPAISVFGGTAHSHVFQSSLPSEAFTETHIFSGMKVTVAGKGNGHAMVLQPTPHELVVIGDECTVLLQSDKGAGRLRARWEAGRWQNGKWKRKGETAVIEVRNNTNATWQISMPKAQVVRFFWE